MINFFRKKRKILANDNKVIKYTRYAIGEIILVVIGILIALQINNWNENRKNKIIENTYIENIKTDLIINLVSLEKFIAKREETVKSVGFILEFFNEQRPLDINEFNFYCLTVMDWNPFEQHDNTYQELLNSGKLSILTNKTIKDSLQNMQTSFKSIQFIESEMEEDYERYLYEPFFSTIDLETSLKGYNQIQTIKKDIPKLDSLNVQLLMKNKTFKNGFVLADFNSKNLIEKYSNIRIRTKKLIELIDDELNPKIK